MLYFKQLFDLQPSYTKQLYHIVNATKITRALPADAIPQLLQPTLKLLHADYDGNDNTYAAVITIP